VDTLVFACPVCGEPNKILPEPADGAQQEFVVDCWVCCRPLRVRLAFSGADDPAGAPQVAVELDA